MTIGVLLSLAAWSLVLSYHRHRLDRWIDHGGKGGREGGKARQGMGSRGEEKKGKEGLKVKVRGFSPLPWFGWRISFVLSACGFFFFPIQCYGSKRRKEARKQINVCRPRGIRVGR